MEPEADVILLKERTVVGKLAVVLPLPLTQPQPHYPTKAFSWHSAQRALAAVCSAMLITHLRNPVAEVCKGIKKCPE